jgi:hypothetical protein
VDQAAYESLRRAVESRMPSFAETLDFSGGPSDQAAMFLGLAREATAALTEAAPSVEVVDKNKYDGVLSMMDRIMDLDGFSLAEYTYRLPDGRSPGLRLYLEKSGDGRRLSFIFFEDVVNWRVDAQGRQVGYQLLGVQLGPSGPAAEIADESRGYFPQPGDFLDCFLRAVLLPAFLAPKEDA